LPSRFSGEIEVLSVPLRVDKWIRQALKRCKF